ncbi:helix-turn-helix domain-containing protein [Acinetobacter sp. WZC-1]|uniref:helix-turn-helix domain-containing protein n=1 Tax=Acinetobacter sp. WZC-1 TaxID=3459034 RepID=UPI00403D7A48
MAVLSSDLRVRAVKAYERNGNKSQVCRTFNIARTTLDDWIKLKSETGSLEQKSWVRGKTPGIKDLDEFRLFLEQTSFNTLKELIPLYEQRFGQPILYERLRRAVHKVGWTHKKRVSPIGNPVTSGNVSLDG